MIVTAGSTNVSVYFYVVQDASATSPGEPVTGLLFSDIETGGSASYARQGAARVDLTLITLGSASASHADGGFILVDDTNMPGLYRCDFPDAAFATGVDQVFLQIDIATAKNAIAAPILVDITDVDFRDSVRGGMTAMPNAAADAAGGLPISDAGGLDLDAQLNSVFNTGTAAGIADGTITLASSHGITDTTVLVYLTGGTNAVGKSRIATYSGSGDVFDVDPAWNAVVNGNTETTPSGTILYAVVPIPPATQTNLLGVNLVQVSGDGGAADNLELDYDGTGYAKANSTIGTATTVTGGATSSALATVDTVVDTILVDTAAMQPLVAKVPLSDGSITWNSTALASINAEADTAITDASLATATNLATVDTVVDAIKVKTDQLIFTKANELDANIQSINGAAVTGDGNASPWDGA